MEPAEVVKSCYEAFGRGDIPGVLSRLAPSVSWTDPGFPDLPYAGARKGPEGVAEFFQGLGAHVEFTSFEPRVFVTSGPEVAVFGAFAGRARKTGAEFRTDWAMRWRVENDRVTLYQAYTDTSATARALGTVRQV